jgi:hypothetical protein
MSKSKPTQAQIDALTAPRDAVRNAKGVLEGSLYGGGGMLSPASPALQGAIKEILGKFEQCE